MQNGIGQLNVWSYPMLLFKYVMKHNNSVTQ